MRARATLTLTALSVAIVTALSAGTASAQTRYSTRVQYREKDEARIRYGVALEGGGLFAPGVVDLGFVGVQGQLGVQVDNLLGFYVAPNIDMVSGSRQERGVQLGGAALVDFTLGHVFTVGVGPDIQGFAALGRGEVAGGLLWGARLHLALNPLVSIARDGVRRRALTIGLDLRTVIAAGAGTLSTRRAAADELVASPTLTIGYQAF